MEDIAALLDKLLGDLGDSADKVAQTLKTKGVRGVRNSVRILNPVVRFVQGALPIAVAGLDVIQAGTFRISLNDGSIVETSMPQAVRDFLQAFDMGAYPEIEIP